MFQKYLKVYAKLKQVPLIMPVHKFGKISLTIKNQIFGHLVVYFIKQLHLNLLLELKIWKVYIKRLLEDYILKFLANILMI